MSKIDWKNIFWMHVYPVSLLVLWILAFALMFYIREVRP